MTAPVATYRLQLTRDFTFRDAAGLADYLARMNLSHVYLSPVLEAVPGSNHGYDCTDFSIVSAERGGEEGLKALDDALAQAGLRMILDIVPNHMSAGMHNPYWQDVLRRGRGSDFWPLFDLRVEEGEKIALPVLSAPPEELIKTGGIRLCDSDAGPCIACGETLYPLREDYPPEGPLENLLAVQHYRLMEWTAARAHMSYRRFFSISELIGLRVEDEAVFEKTHRKIFALAENLAAFAGLRVDHVDGIANPGEYLRRLAARIPAPVWVEKILARGEPLPADWPVAGTTGYEFIDALNGLMVDAAGFQEIQRYWQAQIAPEMPSREEAVAEAKREVMRETFQPEIRRLARQLAADPDEAVDAAAFIEDITAHLPVYRTYGGATAFDGGTIAAAARPTAAASRFLPRLLATEGAGARREWQQLSGAVMAKGVEDRAHYRYTPLAALNEVGCEAEVEGDGIFFALFGRPERATALKTTTTHDTKRAEDVRCRLYALADDPPAWMAFFRQAQECAARFSEGLSPATAAFFFQTLLGSLPFDGVGDGYVERMQAYMRKAAREAALETSWLAPDAAYEARLDGYVAALLQDADFSALLAEAAAPVMRAGAVNSLAMLTLKILTPGVPDFYQGTELWDFSLVDPDNRRAVDYARRKAFLADLEAAEKNNPQDLPAFLARDWRSGKIKMWLMRRLLAQRRRHASFLEAAPVQPLPLAGGQAKHFVACKIGSAEKGLVLVVPRHAGRWPWQPLDAPLAVPSHIAREARLDLSGLGGASFRDLLSGAPVAPAEAGSLAQRFAGFCVCVLAYGGEGE